MGYRKSVVRKPRSRKRVSRKIRTSKRRRVSRKIRTSKRRQVSRRQVKKTNRKRVKKTNRKRKVTKKNNYSKDNKIIGGGDFIENLNRHFGGIFGLSLNELFNRYSQVSYMETFVKNDQQGVRGNYSGIEYTIVKYIDFQEKDNLILILEDQYGLKDLLVLSRGNYYFIEESIEESIKRVVEKQESEKPGGEKQTWGEWIRSGVSKARIGMQEAKETYKRGWIAIAREYLRNLDDTKKTEFSKIVEKYTVFNVVLRTSKGFPCVDELERMLRGEETKYNSVLLKTGLIKMCEAFHSWKDELPAGKLDGLQEASLNFPDIISKLENQQKVACRETAIQIIPEMPELAQKYEEITAKNAEVENLKDESEKTNQSIGKLKAQLEGINDEDEVDKVEGKISKKYQEWRNLLLFEANAQKNLSELHEYIEKNFPNPEIKRVYSCVFDDLPHTEVGDSGSLVQRLDTPLNLLRKFVFNYGTELGKPCLFFPTGKAHGGIFDDKSTGVFVSLLRNRYDDHLKISRDKNSCFISTRFTPPEIFLALCFTIENCVSTSSKKYQLPHMGENKIEILDTLSWLKHDKFRMPFIIFNNEIFYLSFQHAQLDRRRRFNFEIKPQGELQIVSGPPFDESEESDELDRLDRLYEGAQIDIVYTIESVLSKVGSEEVVNEEAARQKAVEEAVEEAERPEAVEEAERPEAVEEAERQKAVEEAERQKAVEEAARQEA